MQSYEYKVAYRHDDETIEGFLGVGTTKAKAKADAHTQIDRKIAILDDWYERARGGINKSRLITRPSTLDPEDLVIVQEDWRSSVRY